MLYLVGLGLGDVRDISVKGLEIVKSADRVYLESYTSILIEAGGGGGDNNKELAEDSALKDLETFYGRNVILADRNLVESGSDEILENADKVDVAFLVVGDPFGATTHSDLILRAKEKGIPFKAIHNASILNAVGATGLQLYNFGETVSIPFWIRDSWEPDSFFDKIHENKIRGMHTLCLLDIKVKEQSVENMMKGRKIYEPPRFMSTKQASEQLLSIIEKRNNEGKSQLTENSLCIAVARIGSDSQKFVTATLKELKDIEMGPPLHSLIIIGKMHCLEEEAVKLFVDVS